MYQRKDGRFCEKITLPNGKTKYFYSSEKTKSKAEKDIQHKLLNYTQKEEKGKLFSEVAEEWSEEHFTTIEYATVRRYTTYINTANSYFDKMHIRDITAINIENMMRDMAVKNYSTKTITDQLSIIKQIFRFAMIKQYITNDVSFYIKPSKGVASVVRQPLTDKEIEIVKNSIECTFGLLAYFLLYTGLRKGELLALKWSDIDFDNKLIHITKSVYYQSNKPYIKSPKTVSGFRDVILLDCLAEKLHKGNTNDYIFGRDGQPLDKTFFTRQWEKYQKETGINATAHQFRHTYATILFEAGIKEKDAQMLMGHSDISVTQNIYTHIRQSRMKETASKLNMFTLNQNGGQ